MSCNCVENQKLAAKYRNLARVLNVWVNLILAGKPARTIFELLGKEFSEFEDYFEYVAQQFEAGHSLGDILRNGKLRIFEDDFVIHSLSVGEDTGDLDTIMRRVAGTLNVFAGCFAKGITPDVERFALSRDLDNLSLITIDILNYLRSGLKEIHAHSFWKHRDVWGKMAKMVDEISPDECTLIKLMSKFPDVFPAYVLAGLEIDEKLVPETSVSDMLSRFADCEEQAAFSNIR